MECWAGPGLNPGRSGKLGERSPEYLERRGGLPDGAVNLA